MSIIAIIVSIISASYYIKIVRVLHTEPENLNHNTENLLNNSIESLNNNSSSSEINSIENKSGLGEVSIISNFHSYLISTLTLSILLFILKPSILLNSTQLLSLSLFNN